MLLRFFSSFSFFASFLCALLLVSESDAQRWITIDSSNAPTWGNLTSLMANSWNTTDPDAETLYLQFTESIDYTVGEDNGIQVGGLFSSSPNQKLYMSTTNKIL